MGGADALGTYTAKDMVKWQQQPIALYPVFIYFSGSAVRGKNNTSGFAKNGRSSMAANSTHYDRVGEKEKEIDIENKSLAYSLYDGKTCFEYKGNPALKNPGSTSRRRNR